MAGKWQVDSDGEVAWLERGDKTWFINDGFAAYLNALEADKAALLEALEGLIAGAEEWIPHTAHISRCIYCGKEFYRREPQHAQGCPIVEPVALLSRIRLAESLLSEKVETPVAVKKPKGTNICRICGYRKEMYQDESICRDCLNLK